MIAIVAAFALVNPTIQKPNYEGWRLVWADEFNKNGAPDPKNWTFEQGFVRNKELQWYQPENARIEHGHLVIEGRREQKPNPNFDATSNDWTKNRPNADYTSSCLETRGLHSWLYGRFEIRAKIDPRPGLWPAIWALGTQDPWPKCGEVDLLEYYRNTILANTCWGNGTWNTVRTPYPDFTNRDRNWSSKYHVWRMDWDKDWLRVYLDDQLLNETDLSKTINPDGSNPFHRPLFLLLNLAIGSTGGDPTNTSFPSRMEVDYVRVYQKKDSRE